MKATFTTVFYFIAAAWMIIGSTGRVIIMVTTGAHIDAIPFITFLLAVVMILVYRIIPADSRPES